MVSMTPVSLVSAMTECAVIRRTQILAALVLVAATVCDGHVSLAEPVVINPKTATYDYHPVFGGDEFRLDLVRVAWLQQGAGSDSCPPSRRAGKRGATVDADRIRHRARSASDCCFVG